jgi:hypothetical protein
MNLLRANSVTSFASESVSAPIQTISNISFIRLEIQEAHVQSVTTYAWEILSSRVKNSGNNFCNGVQAGVCVHINFRTNHVYAGAIPTQTARFHGKRRRAAISTKMGVAPIQLS